jgi:hypothetical protein
MSSIGILLGSASIAFAVAPATSIGTNISTNGTLGVLGDATFDTNTLFVDSANNRVGVGTITPGTALDVNGTVTSTGLDVQGSTIYLNTNASAGVFMLTGTSNGTIDMGNSNASVVITSAGWGIDASGNAKLTSISDAFNGTDIIDLDGVASGVNRFLFSNAASGSTPQITMVGTNTDVGLLLNLKNAGPLTIASTATNADAFQFFPYIGGTGLDVGYFTSVDLTGTRTWTFPDASGTVALTSDLSGFLTSPMSFDLDMNSYDIMNVTSIQNATGQQILGFSDAGSSAVNYVAVANAVSTIAPTLRAVGTDAAIHLGLRAHGARGILVDNDVSGADRLIILPQSTVNNATNTGTITSDNLTTNETWTFPDASGTVCLTNSCISSSLTDNVGDALDIQQGSNNYININTGDGGEDISFGNTVTNPTFNFLGSGGITITGSVHATGGTLNLASGDNNDINLGTGNNSHTVNIGTGSGGSSFINIGTGSSGTTTAISSTAWSVSGAGKANFKKLSGTIGGAVSLNGATDCSSPSVTGNDLRGAVTGTCTTGQMLVIDFAAAFTSAPYCVISPANGTAAAVTGQAFVTSTMTTMTVTVTASETLGTWNYHCIE